MVTIDALRCALDEPAHWFMSLSEARLTDIESLHRTTDFAEAIIEWQGEQWLLSLPLNSSALERAISAEGELRRLRREWLERYHVLYDELTYINSLGEKRCATLVIERLPKGIALNKAPETLAAVQIITAVDLLEREFREAGISHSNIKLSNIHLDMRSGLIYPVRLYNITAQTTVRQFDALREAIGQRFAAGEIGQLPILKYGYPAMSSTNRKLVSPINEGLILIKDEAGYGFADSLNNIIIPTQFTSAMPMTEGRSVVEINGKMGVINRHGDYIIPAEYEQVDYHVACSVFYLLEGGRWSKSDYNGEHIPFDEPNDDVDFEDDEF